MLNNLRYLVVPDVHSRDFWREPVKKVLSETNCKIIFLGDYTDPYWDDFFNDDLEPLYKHIKNGLELSQYAVTMLNDIIELKKQYPDRIILLVGNHDCSYLIGRHICDSRRARGESLQKIYKLFNDNRDLFQLAYEDYINNKHYIFSHAGIGTKYSFDCFFEEVNENNVVELFNKAFKDDDYGILEYLGRVSFYRGGWSDYGSLVWADVREWCEADNEAYGFSVVGHTQLTTHKILDDFAFLDSRQCFSINEKGEISVFN